MSLVSARNERALAGTGWKTAVSPRPYELTRDARENNAEQTERVVNGDAVILRLDRPQSGAMHIEFVTSIRSESVVCMCESV